VEPQLYLGGRVMNQNGSGYVISWKDYNSKSVVNMTTQQQPILFQRADIQLIISHSAKRHKCAVFFGVYSNIFILAEIREESCDGKFNYACIRRIEEGKLDQNTLVSCSIAK